MKGKLYGVGTGAGDFELLTIKALRIIKSCPVIAIACQDKETCVAYKIVESGYPEISQKEILHINMPMTKDEPTLKKSHQDGAKRLCEVLKMGKDIAFLTLGDPSVYSTYMYVHKLVLENGFEAEIINGITSFCACASRLGISLGERDEKITIIPATYNEDSLEEILASKGTKILMKSGKKYPIIRERLLNLDCKAYMAENCTMDGERLYLEKESFPNEAGYYSVIIVK